MTGKQKCLWAFAIVFGIMAIIFYSISIRELDKESAQILGINAVANIQSTTFAAACAVLCGINVVGAMILGSLEGKPSQSNQINSSSEAIAQQSEETPASNGNATDTIVPAEKTIIPAKNGKCNVCGIDIDVNNPLERNYDGNHIYVCEDCACIIDAINDEWGSGKKREKAIANLKERMQLNHE